MFSAIRPVIRKPGNKESGFKIFFYRYFYRLSVKRCTLVFFRKKQFIHHWVVNRSHQYPAIMKQSNADATNRYAMGKIHSTINWVYDPLVIRGLNELTHL